MQERGILFESTVQHGASQIPSDQETRPVFQPVELNTLEKWNAEALAEGLILLQRKAGAGLIYQGTDWREIILQL